MIRKSGNKGLVRLHNATVAHTTTMPNTFDITGLSATGDARANSYEFSIEANTSEAEAYNEDWTRTVSLGISAWSASVTAFYSSAANEINDQMWAMYSNQHHGAACGTPHRYTLFIMPEGLCANTDVWVFKHAMVKTYNPQTPANELMMLEVEFAGGAAARAKIALVPVSLSVGVGTSGATAFDIRELINRHFYETLTIGSAFVLNDLEAIIAGVYDDIGTFRWGATPTTVTGVAGVLLIPVIGTIVVREPGESD